MPSAEAQAGIAIKADEPIVAYHYQMVPLDHPEVDCYMKPLRSHYGTRAENVAKWLAAELAKRADGPIVPAWTGPVPASRRAEAAPTQASCAAAFDAGSVEADLQALEAWRAGQPIKGLVEVVDRGRSVSIAAGCNMATRVLTPIALARAALGEGPPGTIPQYARPGNGARNYPLVDPARHWYKVPLPTQR